MKDPSFLKDAKKRRLEIDPISGEEIEKLVNELYATPVKLVRLTAGYRKPAKVGEPKRKIVGGPDEEEGLLCLLYGRRKSEPAQAFRQADQAQNRR